MNTNKKEEIFFPELSYTINGVCFSVHNEVGPYAKEKQYADVVESKLRETGICFVREFRIGNTGNVVDFLIDDKIILELKAKRLLTKDDYYQVQRYLQETNIKLGLLVNFRNKYIRPARIIRIDTSNRIKFLE